ncbi:MAG: flotillin-like FloA family protein, partial [Planctomyces sp.]
MTAVFHWLMLAQAGAEPMSFSSVLMISLAAIFGLILLVFVVMFATVAQLWFRAWMSGASIGPVHLVVMKLKRINPEVIVDCRINAVQAGLAGDMSTMAMESHMLAGGRVPLVVRAMIAAHRAQIELDWNTAAAIDLAGRNVLEAVQTSVRTKV